MNEPPAPPIQPVESPGRRRLFLAVALAAGGAAAASVGAALGALLLAPLTRRAGASGRADIGPLASFDATREGKAGPQEVVLTRNVEDGYMTRRVRERVAVVRDPASPSGLAVLSTTCSHLGCGVRWSAERSLFLCPCHGGVYDAAGHVVSGPPPRALTRLPLVVDGGRVAVDLSRMESA